eukprot:gnl/TRDRNA2_/TRDRNA2_126291_c0_seq1.p1 gnl/TRDRNA2_/TRDRNA2_126291_c0~~gnl/TRDRNA2_/TRDRNA2_126291_c0_seq1.p1  ORF type:complete len:142 (+),score=24.82 gnl/TRDRNA2_/TRDRNA2_126291_c0_seq1:77-502(+)
MLMRQNPDHTWTALDVHGRLHRAVPSNVAVEEAFFPDTLFAPLSAIPPQLKKMTFDELAQGIREEAATYRALIAGAMQAAGGPLGPALPSSSVQLLQGLVAIIESERWRRLPRALEVCAADDAAWTALRLAEHKAEWMRGQ